jgi:hypothetical protein
MDDDDGRFARSRQPATAASSAAGLKGFCRLETAPSLVAIIRKSGPALGSQAIGSARDHNDRDQRLLLMDQPHRFQPVHSRHEDIEKQQVEISGLERRQPFAAIAGDGNTVAGPFQQDPEGCLDGIVVVDDQDFCHDLLSERTISNQCSVVNLLQSPRKRFFGEPAAMLLKKSDLSIFGYARYRADDSGPAHPVNGSLLQGGVWNPRDRRAGSRMSMHAVEFAAICPNDRARSGRPLPSACAFRFRHSLRYSG